MGKWRFNLYRGLKPRLVTLACWRALLIEGTRLRGNDWIFQHDNAVLHMAGRSKEFFIVNIVILLDYPARSSNLDPTENIWRSMTREVYRNGCLFQTVNDLREAIFTIWDNIPASLHQTPISTMPKRNFEFIHNDIHATHYLNILLGIFYHV